MPDDLLIRRAEINDVVEFNGLVSSLGRVPLFKATFGAFNYSNIVEYSHLSLLATCGSEDNSALGFVSITDSSSVDSLSFENAILKLKPYLPVEVTNTLFINFWAVEENSALYGGDVGIEIVKKLFTTCTDTDYIVWLCPSSMPQTSYLRRLFEEVRIDQSRENGVEVDAFKELRILILRRESYLLKLSVREARVEDNDDLLPILLRSNPGLVDGQEKFFLANLIQTRDESNRFYVGMTKNKLVGMLATSTDVNISLIKKVYDVDIFSDIIMKREPKAKPPMKRIALVGNVQFLEKSMIDDLACQLNCIFVDAKSYINDAAAPSKLQIDANAPALSIPELDRLIVDACNEYMIQHLDNLPVACVITGFPTTEEEVGVIVRCPGIVDIVVEVNRSLGDLAASAAQRVDMEEDAATLCHIDATDLLRSMIDSDDESTAEFRANLRWVQLPDDGDSLTILTDGLTEVVGEINADLRELLGDEDGEEQFYPNAFIMTLSCTAEKSETNAIDMLRVAFEDFPNLDYCLCMVSNAAPVTPLLELMTPVKVRPGVSFNQSLYVMHKEYFLAKHHLSVCRLTEGLLPDLEGFLKPLGSDQRSCMAAARSSLLFNDTTLEDNPMEISFVLLFGSKVVGYVALSRKKITTEDILKLRSSYRLDDIADYERYRTRSQANIMHWIISPTFSQWSRFTMREIMRLYEKTLLYYHGVFSSVPAVEIINELVPVSPRNCMQQPSRPKSSSRGSSFVNSNSARTERGPLFVMTKNRLSQRKTTVNSRIVIVGGTAYAHAVLETFFYLPNLTFSNVYVVNERQSAPFLLGDVAFEGENLFRSEFSGCLSMRDVDDPPLGDTFALGLAYKSTLVKGHLTDIDRENKSIVVSDEVALEYDLLLIASPTQDTTVRGFISTKGKHPSTSMEKGIFGLGCPYADDMALRWVLQHSRDGDSSDANQSSGNSRGGGVVVFGSGMDALAAVGGLIKNNVPSRLISLVISETELEELGHQTINDSVYSALQECGVTVYPGHIVVDVTLNSHFLQAVKLENKMFVPRVAPPRGAGNIFKDRVVLPADRSGATKVESSSQFVTIECSSLLCCVRKSCDADVFAAINESGLVYDGGIVVDERFCTVDSNIYAVGSFTRFSRVYRDAISHQRFNTRELGYYVGRQMVKALISPKPYQRLGTLNPNSGVRVRLPPPVPKTSLPVFSLPRTVSTTLPGGSTLLHSTLPEWTGKLDSQSLVTGKPGGDKLSALRLDYLGCAVQFVYLGSVTIEEQNLSHIVGLHESYLGSALSFHSKGAVTHWTDFFRQSWADIIYHDRLWTFIKDLRASVASDRGMMTVIDKVYSIAASTDDDQAVSAARKRIVGEQCSEVDLTTKAVIEAKSMEFVKKNKSSLKNFYVPPNVMAPQAGVVSG